MIRRISIVESTQESFASWERLNADGERPDRWPYALDRIGGGSAATDTVRLESTTTRQVISAALPRPAGRSRSQQFFVTWDERLAVRAIGSSPTGRLATGVIWLTDEYARMGALRKHVYRSALRRADLTWVHSRAQIEPLRAICGSGTRVEFLRFGVDDRFFKPAPLARAPMILSLGNDRDRDTGTLVSTLERIARARPDVRLVVQARTRGQSPSGVEVVPWMSHTELAKAYHDASLILIATRDNLHLSGMTTMLEANASGRPVVMTRTPGIDDYLVEGQSGVTVPTGQPKALAHAAIELLEAPSRIAAMGDRARHMVETRHRSTDMAEELNRLIDSIA